MRRSFKIAPGVRANFGKNGFTSVSVDSRNVAPEPKRPGCLIKLIALALLMWGAWTLVPIETKWRLYEALELWRYL